ncbi:magnesium chelatase subunit D [Alsobacter sp. R-9]
MSEAAAPSAWAEALAAAMLAAVDPCHLAVCVKARPGPAREQWLAVLRGSLPAGTPWRKLPSHVTDDRLLGGLDLSATLSGGRPVLQRGLLAECDGGFLVVPMAERLSAGTASRLSAALDRGEIAVERDGLAARLPARIGLVLLDEGIDDEAPPAALLERCAMLVDIDAITAGEAAEGEADPAGVAAARAVLPGVTATEADVAALVETAAAFGVPSLRAPLAALHAARASAALDGRDAVTRDDIVRAARLILLPRATRLPQESEQPDEQQQPEPPPEDPQAENQPREDGPLEDRIVDAVAATIPAGLLARLQAGIAARQRAASAGKAGAAQSSALRGRPLGSRRGEPRAGARLDVVETLRAAAPWQRLRRAAGSGRVQVRSDDFRIRRFAEKRETTTIFAVDASGSSALHRMAEAKGAVELLLADCYVRRDSVALVAFRGTQAELLLPPTRSLVRAKRSLAALPGGGGTPLASGLDAALAVAEAARRRGQTPVIVVLTDGRANIARDGRQGRGPAAEDALAAAGRIRATGIASLLIDISPRPAEQGAGVAAAMGGRYLPLPHADAARVSSVVRSIAASG